MTYPPEWGGASPLHAHRLWKGADGVTYDVFLDSLGAEGEPMMLTFVDTWGSGREMRCRVQPGTILAELTDAQLQVYLNEGRKWQ